jgi:hypothetical protein
MKLNELIYDLQAMATTHGERWKSEESMRVVDRMVSQSRSSSELITTRGI